MGLMRWPGGTRRGPIGIDLGSRQLKAMQLVRGAGASWRVEAAALLPRADPGAPFLPPEAARLRDVLRRRGFRGDQVVLAVPADKLLSGNLELPPRSSKAPVEQIARAELARAHKREPESFEFAFWELPTAARANKATQVMAVACPHADADTLLSSFAAAGLVVRALDVEPWALARACKPLAADAGQITAVLDLGWGSCRLVVLHNDVVIYSRQIAEAGLNRLGNSIAEQLGLDNDIAQYLLEEVGLAGEAQGKGVSADVLADARRLFNTHFNAVVEELNVSFSYASHQYPDSSIQRLLLVGGGAQICGLGEYLALILGLDVRAVEPKDLAECPTGFLGVCSSALLTTAMGLAQYEGS